MTTTNTKLEQLEQLFISNPFYQYYWNQLQLGYTKYHIGGSVSNLDIFEFSSILSDAEILELMRLYTLLRELEATKYYSDIYTLKAEMRPIILGEMFGALWQAKIDNAVEFRNLDNIFALSDADRFVPSVLTHLPLTKYALLNYISIPNLYFFNGYTGRPINVSYTEFVKMLFFTNQYNQLSTVDSIFYKWYTVDFYLALPEIFFFF